jgi:predicted Zn-dependent peptidase
MQIRQTALPSGLTVVSAALPEFESAAVLVAVRAGSRDGTAACSGVAHFLEHMAFKGTEARSALDIAVQIECLGAQINAFTSQEVTAYHITGLKDAVPDALAILGDVLAHSRFDEADIATERAVIAQEIARRNDDPGALCIEGCLATLYAGHPLARPVLGDPDFVSHADRRDLLDFVARHYATGRMVVVATGDIDHDWLCGRVAEDFAAIPRGAGENGRGAPVPRGGEFVLDRADFKQINLAIAWPSVPVDAPRFAADKLLSLALGQGLSSPLFQEIRQKRGLVYGVGTGSSHGSDFGMFVVQAGMTPENLDTFLAVAGVELARAREGVAERDFMRARNVMLAELAAVKERPFQLAYYLAGQFFRHGSASGPQHDIDLLRVVEPAALAESARAILAGAPVLSLVGPLGGVAGHLATLQAALG